MAITKAQQKAVQKYVKGNYDRLSILVPKGRRAFIHARARLCGESVNGITNRLYMAEFGLTEAEWKGSADNEQ